MKIEVYVKNRDVEKVESHLQEFKTEIKKGLAHDVCNHSLSSANYRQILKVDIADTSLIEALKTISKLFKSSVDIRIAFKYGSFGNLIFVNYNEIKEFIENNDKLGHEAVERLYQVRQKTTWKTVKCLTLSSLKK